MNKKRLLTVMGGQTSAKFIHRGTILDASYPNEENQIQEPSVIYDTNPQILTGETSVFKMWYSAGFGSGSNLYYAESADGINWTKYSADPVSTATRCFVFKVGSTYVMYGNDSGIKKYTSSDGITWTQDDALVFSAAGAWEAGGMDNMCVYVDGSTWIMVYEANSGSADYKIGVATSTDEGINWTRNANNPVISVTTGMVGGPFLHKIGGTYYLYLHTSSVAALPTDGAKYVSTDLVNWTRKPSNLIIPRTERNEGFDSAAGQVADLHLLEVDGVTYCYYTAMVDGSTASGHINLATCTKSLDYISKADKLSLHNTYPELLLANQGFERLGDGDPDIFDIWIESAGTGTIAETTTAGEFNPSSSSRRAVKLTAGSSMNTSVRQSITSTYLVSGATYRVSGYARGDGTNRGRIRAYTAGGDLITDWDVDTTRITNSTDWTKFECDFVSNGQSVNIYFYCPKADGGVAYFDDISVKRVA